MELTKEHARELCDSIEIDVNFFDKENEEYILLRDNNPDLLEAYEILFAIANID